MIIDFEKLNYTIYEKTNAVRKDNSLSLLTYSVSVPNFRQL
jgi:hypothetical protein